VAVIYRGGSLRHGFSLQDRGELSLLCEQGKPAAYGGLAQRLQQFRHDAVGLLMSEDAANRKLAYQWDVQGYISALTLREEKQGFSQVMQLAR